MKTRWILTGMVILAMSLVVGCGDPISGVNETQTIGKGPWKVTFNVDGGEPVAQQTVKHNGKVEPVYTTKEGHALFGWFKDSMFRSFWDFENDTVTKNVTIFAEFWEVPDGFFRVYFDTDGGNSMVYDQIIKNNQKVQSLSSPPTKDDFVFDGW